MPCSSSSTARSIAVPTSAVYGRKPTALTAGTCAVCCCPLPLAITRTHKRDQLFGWYTQGPGVSRRRCRELMFQEPPPPMLSTSAFPARGPPISQHSQTTTGRSLVTRRQLASTNPAGISCGRLTREGRVQCLVSNPRPRTSRPALTSSPDIPWFWTGKRQCSSGDWCRRRRATRRTSSVKKGYPRS